MSKVPAVSELVKICGGEGTDPSEARTFRTLYARIVRKISIRITWLILHTRASANQITVLGVLIGIAGAALLTQNNSWVLVAAVVLLQLSFVVDFCDGEVARYRGQSGGGGAYLDWIGHYYVPATAVAATAYAAWANSGQSWVLIAGFVLILGLVRIPFSARDHVMLGLYRDYPELRGRGDFTEAVLARQGGNPNAVIATEEDFASRRAGTEGKGLLWQRYTNLGQLLVYPGFVNLLSLAVAVDLVISAAGGHFPTITESSGREVLIGALGAVQLAHQLRAAVQGFTILKRFD